MEAEDTRADLAVDTPLPHPAVETSAAVVALTPHPAVSSIAAIAAIAAAVRLRVDAGITAAGDIMALDSA